MTRSLNKILALLTLATTLTISDFPFIRNPKSNIQNFQVLAQTADARKAEADRLLQQGREQFRSNQFEAALQSWQQALIIYQQIKDRQGEGKALGNLGSTYRTLGDYAKAIEYLQQSLAIAREIKDRLLEGKALGNLGVAYYSLGNYAKAIEYHQQSLAIAREIKDPQSEGQSLGNLGVAYYSLGDYTKAIEYHQQSLTILQEIKDPQSEGASLGNLGNVYDALGDYAKAIDYHQQRLVIAKSIKDRLGEGQSLGNLGNAYYGLGDYAKAIDYYQQRLAIAREIKDRLGEGAALNNLGITYSSLGNYAKAIDYYQQRLAIAREIKYRLGEGQSLGNLGNAYYGLGDYTKAIDYHQQRLAIAREIKDRLGEGQSLGNLGVAYDALGDYTKAIDYHQQRLAIAREIKDRLGEGDALGNLGNAYDSLGDYTKAIEYQQQRLTITQEIGDLNGEGQSLNNLGNAVFKSGNLPEAEKILRTGIEARESLRKKLGDNDANKVSVFEQQAKTYRLLQEVLIAQNKTNDALEVAEAGRAKALAELLVTRLSANPTEQSPITSPTIEQIKQIAKEQNATVVQYSIIFNRSLYIWVVKPTGEIAFRSVNFNTKDADQTELINTVVSGNGAVIRGTPQDTVVPELLAETRSALGVGRYATIEVEHKGAITSSQRLNQLHQLLIEPIADLFPTKPEDRVIFIPQGGLFLVPFAALQDKKGDYLIEKHTISIAPSIQVLDLTRKQQQVRANRETPVRGNDVLIVGNPTMPQLPQIPGLQPIKLLPLPGAEQEALEIADFFGTQAITGNAATEKAIAQKLPNARIIHLATHGLLEYGNPQDSGVRDLPGAIALAPSAPDDGLLTSAEIFEMNLQAELVVLSACDTGQGKIRADGVVGLSRSLIKAGVPSTLVSLWSVPDAPTAELMTEFYRQWQQSSDKAQALRQAMLVTMRTHPNPRDWAAFTLIGEAE